MQDVQHILPYDFARSNRLLVDQIGSQLIIGPGATVWAMAEVGRNFRTNLGIKKVDDASFENLLSELYSNHQSSSELVMEDIKEFVDIESAAADLEGVADLLDAADDAPIIRLLNAIFAESLKERASDIHIEPYEKNALVRFRLDGVLQTVLSPSAQITPLLVSRIKVMSKLDIAEKRLPQDGRMTVRLGGKSIDLRVSTMPSSHGERVVMRLLDKEAGKLKVDDLGMPSHIKNGLGELITRPHGIILVTGPTGSGKTTTLYAALQQMNHTERNIMTVEDPVEYDLPGVSQTQINLRAGMTFSKGLRAILRQDPDVILLGEIRDVETAEIATQASLTGHLVLSTLHTNTAAGAVTRLHDLGVDSFLLSSTIRGILSQRLLRKLCVHCKETLKLNEYHIEQLMLDAAATIFEPRGCSICKHTGYDGRQALFELVKVDAHLQSIIYEGSGELNLEAAIRQIVPSIREEGLRLVERGITSIEEVLRVTST